MTDIETILSRAASRTPGEPYGGAVTPQEAYALVHAAPHVKLVDVRTHAERDWIGRVTIPDMQHGFVEWASYPGGAQNPRFIEQLRQVAHPEDVVLFLCRSGVRSKHAAQLATAAGFANCYNILEGFEGDKDAEGHRKTVGGWCKHGLPWTGA